LDTEPYPAAGSLINAENFNLEFFVGLLVLMMLIIASALVSGSEVAFFSLTPSDVDQLKKKKTKNSEKLILLLQKPKSLLGTILISNNLVNIAIVVLAAYLINMAFDFSQSPIIGFLVQIVGITFILLLFGEIIPKVYATHNGVAFAHSMSVPMSALSAFFKPFSYLLVKGTTLIDRKIKKNDSISYDELSDAIDLTSNVTTEEEDILKGIVEFSSIEASEIMKPRVDIVTVDIKTNFKNLLQVITASGYSRIPVHHNSLDNIKGVLYIKDLLPHLEKPETFGWQSLIRPPYFVPENKRVNELLEELQEKHIHMAIVVDEYGGTSGIVTLEDVIEEIIGEISDEFDEEERNHTRINANTFLFEGKTSINDFCRTVDYDGDLFNDVNADTLAGLVLEHTGEMPKQFDIIKIDRFEFKVESVDNRRIKKIQVKIDPEV
jgi:gliding motility-associated protein GldE